MPDSGPSLEQRLRLRDLPAQDAVMYQTWSRLLFLHWKFDPGEIQKLLPANLFVDTFDGVAWVGVVPFFMRGIRPIWSPAVPGLSNFLELNIRTYVYDQLGRPGVWFFSLDASNPIAVLVARLRFKLPYFWARMRARATPATVDYWSQRKGLKPDHFVWQPLGEETVSLPGSLEFFLLERYLLFSQHPAANQLYSGRVHHEPYRLRETKVLSWGTNLLEPAGLTAPDRIPDHITSSATLDVRVFPLQMCA